METPRTTEASPRDGPEQQQPQETSERLGRLAIYAASLSDYNNGILHGTWVEADENVERMQGEIASMLEASPTTKRYGDIAEEWAIHDHEGFEPYPLQEYSGLDTVATLAEGIIEHGQAFAAWAAWRGEVSPEVLRSFEDAYLGEWDSLEHYAEEILDDFGLDETLDQHIPESLRPYVKVEAAGFARDLELGGDVSTWEAPGGRVWVFDAGT